MVSALPTLRMDYGLTSVLHKEQSCRGTVLNFMRTLVSARVGK